MKYEAPQIKMPDKEQLPWYAVRLFTIRQQAVADYFKEANLEWFIPMHYVDFIDREGKRRRELRSVVRNLIFIKKDRAETALRKVFDEAPYKLSVIRKERGARSYYEIPAAQMREFMIMCNPDVEMRKYLTEEEARLKTGTHVLVTHGPLAGLTGKLVRQSKKYYLLKEVPGIAIMIKVSRWCCRGIE